MTSYSRNSGERQSENGFSNYLDSKYPINSRSNFTFHEFLSENNLLDDSVIRRFVAFSQKVNKFSINSLNRLLICQKDVVQLQKSVQHKTNEDLAIYNTLFEDIDQTVRSLEEQCQQIREAKSRTADQQCRWIIQQLNQIKDGFKSIQKQRKQEIREKIKELQQDIQGVKNKLEKQKIQRDQISQSQIQQFGEAILQIQERLSIQREERIENNNFLVQNIEKMDQQLDRMLEKQKTTREKKQALFATLLEQTYIKLQRI